jgi:hypothetical protein
MTDQAVVPDHQTELPLVPFRARNAGRAGSRPERADRPGH